ncbi:hypothetical protein ACEWY4_014144 [Coilia grayii]|uniref:pancreatic elastase n=1 Tax=Coilia grayii TaxID=363190 RepID=A0ABD1JRG0_9TELE
MRILPILSILYALFAMSMAEDASAEGKAVADSHLEKQQEVIDALDSDDDARAAKQEESPADNPVSVGSDVEVTNELDEEDVTGVEVLHADAEVLDEQNDQPAEAKAPIQKRVVGGVISPANFWKWQVSLQYRSGSRYFHTCGGVLVRRNWVLTAAHCVDRSRVYRVVAGEHDLNTQNCREQFVSVRRVHLHPGWRRNLAIGNDIALLHLSSSVTLNRYVTLATLPPTDQVLSHNYACVVSGWGRTSSGGSSSNVLRHALLRVVSYSMCRQPSWWGNTVNTNMVCAGGNGRQAGCQGDSGGPLNCHVGGRWVVHGITSFVSSRGCNILRKPTVFSRVSAHSSWIRSLIGA